MFSNQKDDDDERLPSQYGAKKATPFTFAQRRINLRIRERDRVRRATLHERRAFDPSTTVAAVVSTPGPRGGPQSAASPQSDPGVSPIPIERSPDSLFASAAVLDTAVERLLRLLPDIVRLLSTPHGHSAPPDVSADEDHNGGISLYDAVALLWEGLGSDASYHSDRDAVITAVLGPCAPDVAHTDGDTAPLSPAVVHLLHLADGCYSSPPVADGPLPRAAVLQINAAELLGDLFVAAPHSARDALFDPLLRVLFRTASKATLDDVFKAAISTLRRIVRLPWAAQAFLDCNGPQCAPLSSLLELGTSAVINGGTAAAPHIAGSGLGVAFVGALFAHGRLVEVASVIAALSQGCAAEATASALYFAFPMLQRILSTVDSEAAASNGGTAATAPPLSQAVDAHYYALQALHEMLSGDASFFVPVRDTATAPAILVVLANARADREVTALALDLLARLPEVAREVVAHTEGTQLTEPSSAWQSQPSSVPLSSARPSAVDDEDGAPAHSVPSPSMPSAPCGSFDLSQSTAEDATPPWLRPAAPPQPHTIVATAATPEPATVHDPRTRDTRLHNTSAAQSVTAAMDSAAPQSFATYIQRALLFAAARPSALRCLTAVPCHVAAHPFLLERCVFPHATAADPVVRHAALKAMIAAASASEAGLDRVRVGCDGIDLSAAFEGATGDEAETLQHLMDMLAFTGFDGDFSW